MASETSAAREVLTIGRKRPRAVPSVASGDCLTATYSRLSGKTLKARSLSLKTSFENPEAGYASTNLFRTA